MGESRGVCRVFGGETGEKETTGDPGIDGRIILRWILRKWDVRAWTGSTRFREGQVSGHCECGNEPLGSVKCGEFLD